MATIIIARCVGHGVDLKLRGSGPAPKGRPKHEAPFRCPAARYVPGGKTPECEWAIEAQPEELHGQPPD